MIWLLTSLCVLINISLFGQNQNNLLLINNQTYNIKEGDLFFQDLDSSPLCEAIEKVTKSVNGKNFSHIGICIIKNSELYILEAFSNGVKAIKIEDFLKRSLNEYGYPKITIGRVKPKYQYLIDGALQKGKLLIGKDYDELFIMDNDKYYCSELIYDIFLNSDYRLFELEPMTFKEPGSEKFMQIWVDYFNELSTKIPEGMLGINPGGISRSKNINIIYDLEKNKN